MQRRRFLKGVAQLGTGVGIAGVTAGCAQATAKPQEGVASGTPVIALDGEWSLATDPQNVGRTQQWFASTLRETP